MQAGSRRTQEEEEEEEVGVPCFLRRLTCWFVGAAWLHVCHRSWRLVWQWREDEWGHLLRQELWSSLWSHLLCLSLQPYQSSPPIFSLLHPVSVHNNVFPIHTANNQVPFEHPIPLKTRTFFNNPQLENLAEKEEDEEEKEEEEEDHLQFTAVCCLLAGMMIRILRALGRNHQTQLRTAAARLVGKLTVGSA